MNTSTPLRAAKGALLPADLTRERLARRALAWDIAAVAAACVIFLGIAFYQLDLPGLYTDEAYDVIPSMQMVLGHHVELQGGVLDLGGLHLPLMSSSAYQGVTYTYLALPFFAIGGVNVISLRTMTVLVGALGIVLSYFLGRSWFGRVEGRLTALLMATSPAWIFWSRLGVYVVSVVVPIAVGALLAFTHWARQRPLGRKNASFYLGMFLLGLGLTTKLLFLWFVAALAVTALLLWARVIWEKRASWTYAWLRWLRVGAAGVAAFCLGALPFILYNLLTRGTYYLIKETLQQPGPTASGVSNSAILRNMWTEADAFKVLLDGGYFWFQGKDARTYFNFLTPSLFVLSATGLVVYVLASRRGAALFTGRAFLLGALLSVVGLGAAGIKALLPAAGAVPTGLTLASTLCSVVGTATLIVLTARFRGYVVSAGVVLLPVMLLSGALWWFGGAGRPEGPAPGASLGLWPVDAAAIVFWVTGLGIVLGLCLDPAPAPKQRAVAATLALTGLLVAQSSVTISGLWSTHLLVILPLPQLVIAAFVVAAGRWLAARSPGLASSVALSATPALLLVGLLVVLDLGVDYSYQRDLGLTGGGSTFSDAIYRLTDFLERDEPGHQVVAMDWGFRRPIEFLTQERIDPIEGYGLSQSPPPAFYASLRQFIADPGTIYLFHTPEGTAYPREDAFKAEAAREGKQVTLVRTFTHRDGRPVYLVYQVK